MIAEIIFSIFAFCLIWFIIFKVKLKHEQKNLLKDIAGKLEKQNKKFFNDGKEVNLKKDLGIEETEDNPGETGEEKKEDGENAPSN